MRSCCVHFNLILIFWNRPECMNASITPHLPTFDKPGLPNQNNSIGALWAAIGSRARLLWLRDKKSVELIFDRYICVLCEACCIDLRPQSVAAVMSVHSNYRFFCITQKWWNGIQPNEFLLFVFIRTRKFLFFVFFGRLETYQRQPRV